MLEEGILGQNPSQRNKSSRGEEARPYASFSPSLCLSSRLAKVPSSHPVMGDLQPGALVLDSERMEDPRAKPKREEGISH